MEWYIPLIIFAARMLDVPLGTIRMIFVIGGSRVIASVLGFFEVIVWVVAVGSVITYLSNPIALIAYGAGFACGTLLGMTIEQRIGLGLRVVRVINSNREFRVSSALREKGYRVTELEGMGLKGPVEIAFLVIKRRELQRTLDLIQQVAPQAFVSVERADRAQGAGFADGGSSSVSRWSLGRIGGIRK
ncbi:MAG: DUF2179 domain-containing protein [Planctomycetota bacterium]